MSSSLRSTLISGDGSGAGRGVGVSLGGSGRRRAILRKGKGGLELDECDERGLTERTLTSECWPDWVETTTVLRDGTGGAGGDFVGDVATGWKVGGSGVGSRGQ